MLHSCINVKFWFYFKNNFNKYAGEKLANKED